MNQIFSVSQVNAYIHRIIESDFTLRRIHIKGEVSNCKYHSSGHIYFTLKDARSAMSCVMFSGKRARGLKFRMENGNMVTVYGSISVYDRDGKYQLYAEEITSDGAGLLYQRFEELKQELYEKGYFDFEHKKPLPSYPQKIGIVTAATGAAIQDIKSVAARRNPYVQLYLYPAKVQGEGAAETIVDGIRFFDRAKVDLIIIGRGGGSIEDLWAFNERIVADAIYEAETPIISGTGHEVDNTIADYCADLRAPTPSAACEMAIPDVFVLLQELDRYQDDLESALSNKIYLLKDKISVYQRLLEANHPGARLEQQKEKCSHYQERLLNIMDRKIQRYQNSMDFYGERLTALSPSMRLRGGYVFAQKCDDTPIASVTQLEENEEFQLIFKDGNAKVRTLTKTVEKEG